MLRRNTFRTPNQLSRTELAWSVFLPGFSDCLSVVPFGLRGAPTRGQKERPGRLHPAGCKPQRESRFFVGTILRSRLRLARLQGLLLCRVSLRQLLRLLLVLLFYLLGSGIVCLLLSQLLMFRRST